MKIKELLKHLEHVNPELEVKMHYDESPRGDVETIYIARDPHDSSVSGMKLCIGDLWGQTEADKLKSDPLNQVIYAEPQQD